MDFYQARRIADDMAVSMPPEVEVVVLCLFSAGDWELDRVVYDARAEDNERAEDALQSTGRFDFQPGGGQPSVYTTVCEKKYSVRVSRPGVVGDLYIENEEPRCGFMIWDAAAARLIADTLRTAAVPIVAEVDVVTDQPPVQPTPPRTRSSTPCADGQHEWEYDPFSADDQPEYECAYCPRRSLTADSATGVIV